MSEEFDRLSDADKALIIALPYRVGLWMSTLEGDGGDTADELESMAMIEAIERTARSVYYEFAAYICRQTLHRRDRWLSWSADFVRVPQECGQAIRVLTPILSTEELNLFREALFLIAAAVARAYREGTENARDLGAPDTPGMAARILSKLYDTLGGIEDRQNISIAEASALRRLASFLGLESLPRALR